MLNRHKNWLVHKQTACGKDFSNLFMVDNLPKIIGFSTHLASVVKSWLVHDQTVHALASPKANELTIPEKTATGKGTSIPFMASSLPKTTKPTTGHALIDVYGEEITLRVDNEAITFNLDQTIRYSSTNDKSVNRIDIIDEVCEKYAPELLGFSNKSSGGNPTPMSKPLTSEFILEEIEAYLKDDSISLEIDHADCDSEGDICLI
ncbi:hypothetical protein Tco_0010570 [Tanacetum coccineum]